MSTIKAWRWLPFAFLLLWQAIAIPSASRHAMADVERMAAISASTALEVAVLSDAHLAVDLHDRLAATHHEGGEHDSIAGSLKRQRPHDVVPPPAARVVARLQQRYLEAPKRPPRHVV